MEYVHLYSNPKLPIIRGLNQSAKLKMLYIKSCGITDYSFIADLDKAEIITIDAPADLAPVAKMKSLNKINLHNCKADLAPLASLSILSLSLIDSEIKLDGVKDIKADKITLKLDEVKSGDDVLVYWEKTRGYTKKIDRRGNATFMARK